MSGPLSKYRIIDLTAMVSGPYATQLLGWFSTARSGMGVAVIRRRTAVGAPSI